MEGYDHPVSRIYREIQALEVRISKTSSARKRLEWEAELAQAKRDLGVALVSAAKVKR